jgi:hypothetical protein
MTRKMNLMIFIKNKFRKLEDLLDRDLCRVCVVIMVIGILYERFFR